MPIERVYLFHCFTPRCHDYAVLPRQSHLGKFDDQLCPSTGIWPINYLCQKCGQMSSVPIQAIHPAELETQDQSPLIWYQFSNGQPNSLVRIEVYSKELDPYFVESPDANRAIEFVLKLSGLWQDSYGHSIRVAIDSRWLI